VLKLVGIFSDALAGFNQSINRLINLIIIVLCYMYTDDCFAGKSSWSLCEM